MVSLLCFTNIKKFEFIELNIILYNDNLERNFNGQNTKIKNKSKRIFEILRNIDLNDGGVFHSTYYRGLRNKKTLF